MEKSVRPINTLRRLSCKSCKAFVDVRATDDPESWPMHRCRVTMRPARFTSSEVMPRRYGKVWE